MNAFTIKTNDSKVLRRKIVAFQELYGEHTVMATGPLVTNQGTQVMTVKVLQIWPSGEMVVSQWIDGANEMIVDFWEEITFVLTANGQ